MPGKKKNNNFTMN